MRGRSFRVFRVVVPALIVVGLWAFLSQPGPGPPGPSPSAIRVIAHRGGGGLWPEETLYAFEQAMRLGVDVLDVDVHATRDSVLVVIHDRTVDRTTDGTGPVEGLTLAELQALDAGCRWTDDDGRTFPFRGRGLRIPTLAEVFEAFPDARMVIEIKPSRADVAGALGRMIRAYGRADRVVVASRHRAVIRALRRGYPEIATGAGFGETLTTVLLNRVRLDGLYAPDAGAFLVPEQGLGLRVITPRFIQAARRHGLQVHVWTVNDTLDMRRLIGLGVDGIFTDRPDRLLRLLGREKGGTEAAGKP